MQKLAEMGQPLGPQLHVQTDYGDEFSGRLPWELFGEEEAKEALAAAAEIVTRTERLIEGVSDE